MDAKTKRDFIRKLCNAVRDDVLRRVPAMPDDWDGIEIREYLADKFRRESAMRNMYGKIQPYYLGRFRRYGRTSILVEIKPLTRRVRRG